MININKRFQLSNSKFRACNGEFLRSSSLLSKAQNKLLIQVKIRLPKLIAKTKIERKN